MKPSEILIRIKQSKHKRSGICDQYNTIARDTESTLLYPTMDISGIQFSNWFEYSGSNVYPVKSYDSIIAPSTAYSYAYYSKCMWDRRTKYGKARWQLLDWLIEQFQAKGQ